jgi:aryl-alcohol dehydrogenase-like predicted oxidoreductase
MDLCTFNDSDLLVTPIGLGLAAVGRPGYINLGHSADLNQTYDVGTMRAHAYAVLDAAWTAGIRYFDAARSYGRAESFLGGWLMERTIAQDEVFVASKWGYTYTAEWQVDAEQHEVKEHTRAVLERQWQESRALLDDYLRLYQIHSATFDSGVLENVAVLDELARRKADGMLIGLSLSGANQGDVLRTALDVRVDGVALFDAVQATWNLLEPSAGPALAEASAAGLAVVVKEALANGRLTPRNDNPAFAAKLALLEQEATRLATTIDALALAAVLAQPWTTVVLSGAASLKHVHSNVGALDVPWDEAAATVLATLSEAPATYWQTRGELAWN